MRLTSFRTRVLLLGILSASIIVGAVLITTYVVVVEGMNDVATAETSRLAERAAALGVGGVDLSMTHSRELAQAVAIADGGD